MFAKVGVPPNRRKRRARDNLYSSYAGARPNCGVSTMIQVPFRFPFRVVADIANSNQGPFDDGRAKTKA